MINNCNNWFYLCLALLGLILILVAMFMGYNLKLDKRTVKLEKKNGSEQKQINELKQRINQLENFADSSDTLLYKKKYQPKDNKNQDHER